MSASLRDDLSWPFFGLAVVLAGVIAVGYLRYPAVFSIDRELALAYGALLVGFAAAYSYRPLRESAYGPLVTASLLMLFTGVLYVQGVRNPLLPFGLFAVALAAFCYELYQIRSGRSRRGQAS